MAIAPSTFGVMLASQHSRIVDDIPAAIDRLMHNSWHFSTKLDGVRAMAYVEDGKARLIIRRNADASHRYPELIAGLELAYPTGEIVLDGEIVVLNGDGHADFAATHRRDAQSKSSAIRQLCAATPATFVAFDILWRDGDDLRTDVYSTRWSHLAAEANTWNPVLPLRLVAHDTDGHALWDRVMAYNGEGLVAKDPRSRYHAGRSLAWIKIKSVFTVSAVAVGYTEGQGARAGGIGAIELALVGPDGALPWGKVGTGFTEHDLADVKARMDAGHLLVMDVEIQCITQDGAPRFPSYRGIRSDISPAECTVSQLVAIPTL